MKRIHPSVLGVLLVGLAIGCADNASHGDVRGEVTFGGAPLKEGVIRFVPLDGKTPTASALIVDGKFAERVPIGSHRVEISSPKLPKGITSARQMKRGTVDEGSALEEMIPARYNDRSVLKETVKRGLNEVRYDLQK